MPVESVDYHFDPQELTLILTSRYFRAAPRFGLLAFQQTIVLDLHSSRPASLILSPPCRAQSDRTFVRLNSHAEESAEPQAQEEEASW